MRSSGIVETPQSWYLDLNMIAKYVTGEGARAYHHTAPISMIYALHAGLGVVLDEGLEDSWARHAECGELLQDGLRDAGLRAVRRRRAIACPSSPPCGCRPRSARRHSTRPACGARCSSATASRSAAGSARSPGKVWRIGCMGHTARLRNVTAARSAALDEILLTLTPMSRRCFGRRVVLRPLTPADFTRGARCAAATTTGSPSGSRARIPGQPDVVEDRDAFAVRCSARQRERQLGTGYGFGVFVDGDFAGEINLSSVQRGPFQSAYVGYWIDEKHAGQRLHARGGVVVLRGSRSRSSRLHRLQISIIPRNTASRRVVEKLEIREEGVAVRYLEINGVWEDHVRYAITAEEWERAPRRAVGRVAVT